MKSPREQALETKLIAAERTIDGLAERAGHHVVERRGLYAEMGQLEVKVQAAEQFQAMVAEALGLDGGTVPDMIIGALYQRLATRDDRGRRESDR